MKEALIKTDEKYRTDQDFLNSILSNMSDYVYVIDEDFNFRFLNEAAKKVYGEIVGVKCYKAIRNINSPCYYKGLICDVQEILKKGKKFFEETRLNEATNRIVHFRARPTRTFDGKRAVIVVGRDITEEEHAKEKLRKSEERYRTLFKDSRDAIIISSRGGKIIEVNQSVMELFGYTRKEMIGLNAQDLYARPKDRHLYQQEIEQKGFVRDYEVKFRKRDGSVMDCMITSTARCTKDGKILEYLAIIRDITERKQAEKQLKRYSKHLEELVEKRTKKLKEAERLAAIGETASMVGHDLRDPLQAIFHTLFLEREILNTISKRLKIEEKNDINKLLGSIEDQLKYMNKIVSDLQDYARPINPEIAEIDLRQLIHDTLKTITPPKNINFSIRIKNDFPTLKVDNTLMKRIFLNLVTNAMQSMPEGGEVTINASKRDNKALISVKDTGIGISKKDLDKLFTPLYSTKAKGQGLGLAVCKRLVEVQGGNITFNSNKGKGSIFVIEIPLIRKIKDR